MVMHGSDLERNTVRSDVNGGLTVVSFASFLKRTLCSRNIGRKKFGSYALDRMASVFVLHSKCLLRREMCSRNIERKIVGSCAIDRQAGVF